jgi:hypothetical protein
MNILDEECNKCEMPVWCIEAFVVKFEENYPFEKRHCQRYNYVNIYIYIYIYIYI